MDEVEDESGFARLDLDGSEDRGGRRVGAHEMRSAAGRE